MDLMFQNGTPLLTVINVITRYAYAFRLKNKSAAEVNSALMMWAKLVRDKPEFVQSDGGSEFINKTSNEFFAERGIERSIAEPGDHRGQAVIERFHGTSTRSRC
jgi:transposase InsO family protein